MFTLVAAVEQEIWRSRPNGQSAEDEDGDGERERGTGKETINLLRGPVSINSLSLSLSVASGQDET